MFLAILHRASRLPHGSGLLHGTGLLHLLFKAMIVCVVAALLTYIVHRLFKLAGCALAAVFFIFCVFAVVLRIGAAIFFHH